MGTSVGLLLGIVFRVFVFWFLGDRSKKPRELWSSKREIRDTSAALNVKAAISKKKVRSRQKKWKAYDLSSLSAFLPDLKTGQSNIAEPSNSKLNCKSRQKLILKEAKQLSVVLNHPEFQLDPLGAIHQHLQSTQPVEKPDRKMNKNKRKEKKKRSKASTGSQSMNL